MNNRDIGLYRLARQRIAQGKFDHPEDVVRWMGALQAQDYKQSVWAIGLRTHSGTLADVEQALEDGTIIRTWPMRGTIHFVLPEDARWMLKLSASRMLAADQRRMNQLELSDEIMVRCQALFRGALSGRKRLSRPDMMKLLNEVGISTAQQRGYHILWHCAQSGVICMGPVQGGQQTFELLDEWAPAVPDLPREEALAGFVRRYFFSHGPATVHDFAWWAGLTLTDARRGLASVRSELVSVVTEDKEFWMGGDALSPGGEDESGVYLLPGFDEFLLGYSDRRAVLAAEYAPIITPGSNGIFQPIMVAAGQVVGTWKRSVKKKGIDITLVPFAPSGDERDRALEAAQLYADFVGLPLQSATGY